MDQESEKGFEFVEMIAKNLRSLDILVDLICIMVLNCIDIQERKEQKENEVEVKSKGEKAQDIKNFEALVGLMLSTSRVHPVNFPDDVFGESFKTFLMKEDMDMIISSKEVSSNCILYYIWHLHRKLIDGKQVEQYVFVNPALVSQAGMGEGRKENRAIRINPPEKQKTSKREPTWVKVVCPRQPGSVECGYYVMRYMKEIIANPNQLTSKVCMQCNSYGWSFCYST
ncbi:hypothetical protein CK203_038387 [Vitis vinifera]|uniref:Ubiquitin-like protease family profile domain-containing protein n=1 Tax=Vitis vinifera TaxID=29760 RepID=A0A438HEK6_VITVI|nr:hypothetical protein CK203_038387 [Vitis vinifera]